MKKVKKVVGVAFIEDGKLLIVRSVRSSKSNTWTLIGGGVEEGESEVEAAIREVKEEFHNGFTISEEDLKPLMCFKESASSDPELDIIMTMFICKKKMDKVYFTIRNKFVGWGILNNELAINFVESNEIEYKRDLDKKWSEF